MTNPFAQPATAPAAPAPAPAATNPFAAQPAPAAAPPAPAAQPNPFAAVTAPLTTPAGPDHPIVQAAAAAQVAPPAAQQFAGDPFSGPAPQQPRGPRLREMAGRLLLVIPTKVEYGVLSRFKNNDGSPQYQDRMTADVIVLDGGPIHYGGKPENKIPVPHDKVAQVPHVSKAMFISSVGLVSQCRDAYAARQKGQPGMVLGRLTVGEQKDNNEPPWLLSVPTEADAQLARQYLMVNPIDPFQRA